MPIIPQTYACDNCGIISKPEPDHWYVIRGRPIDPTNEFNRRAPSLDIQVFYPGWTYWPSAMPPYFACGEGCLMAIINRLLPGLNVDPEKSVESGLASPNMKTAFDTLTKFISELPMPPRINPDPGGTISK